MSVPGIISEISLKLRVLNIQNKRGKKDDKDY